MTSESNGSLPPIISTQKALCAERKVGYVPSPVLSNLGFAVSTKGKLPINGLRHRVVGNTSGWHIWCGETFSDDAAFFVPIHAGHIFDDYPEIANLLGLPPSFRFLYAPDQLDVWFDESLLNV